MVTVRHYEADASSGGAGEGPHLQYKYENKKDV